MGGQYMFKPQVRHSLDLVRVRLGNSIPARANVVWLHKPAQREHHDARELMELGWSSCEMVLRYALPRAGSSVDCVRRLSQIWHSPTRS